MTTLWTINEAVMSFPNINVTQRSTSKGRKERMKEGTIREGGGKYGRKRGKNEGEDREGGRWGKQIR